MKRDAPVTMACLAVLAMGCTTTGGPSPDPPPEAGVAEPFAPEPVPPAEVWLATEPQAHDRAVDLLVVEGS